MTKGSALKRTEGLVGGGILMLMGTLFLLDQLDLYEFRQVWTWWPLFPLAFGLARLAGAEDHRQRRSGAWLAAMGAWMLISVKGWFGFHWGNSWPLLLIALGALMTWQSLAENRGDRGEPGRRGDRVDRVDRVGGGDQDRGEVSREG